jgi:hypothetical protein
MMREMPSRRSALSSARTTRMVAISEWSIRPPARCSPRPPSAAASSSMPPSTPPPRRQRDWKSDEASDGPPCSRWPTCCWPRGRAGPGAHLRAGQALNDANIEVFARRHLVPVLRQPRDPPQIIQDDDEALVEVVNRPLGVVAAITPWNFPLTLAFWKIAPALLAGNTMVLKPSPFTPLSTLKVVELLRDVCPPAS